MRLDTKRAMQRTEESVERSRLDAMQSSFKILINSFYGYLGYNRALFNDHARADEVTKTGQKILRTMIAEIRAGGGKVVEVDTDGIFFVPPVGVDTGEQESVFISVLSSRLPEGITVAMDGRNRKILSYKKKNYALLGYDNKIRIKGSSLVSRSMEQFGRTYVHQCIDFILHGDFKGLHRRGNVEGLDRILRGRGQCRAEEPERRVCRGNRFRASPPAGGQDQLLYYWKRSESEGI
jgi:DNA polymerase elongation subunit (family B)